MKILYLTYDGLSDPLGQSQILPYLKGLSGKGYEITIVSFEKINILKPLFSTLKNELDKNNIRWIIIHYTKHPPVVSTLYDVYRLRNKCAQLQKRYHFQIVHCRGYITSLAGQYLKKKFGLKFIFDMRGFFADERAESGLWNQKRIVYRLIYNYFKKQENEFLLAADKIVVLTNAAKNIIYDKFHIGHSKMSVIPCCVDTGQFDPGKIDLGMQASWKQKLLIGEDDFVISYLGSMGTWYLLNEMLDFFHQLTQTFTNAKFLFITHHPKEDIMRSAAKKNISMERIVVVKAQRKEVPLLLSLSQLSVFFIMPTFSKTASSPTKQAEIFSMGIPVVCNTGIGDAEEIISQSGAGILIDRFTKEAFELVINKIPHLLNKNKLEIRNFAITMFSLSKGVEQYSSMYHELERPLSRVDSSMKSDNPIR